MSIAGREIALLYGELIRYEPTPMIEANRAVAVAMSEGPAAGLVILDTVDADALSPGGRSCTSPARNSCAAWDGARRRSRPTRRRSRWNRLPPNAPTWPAGCARGSRQQPLRAASAPRGKVGP
jgi:hypothetical protein